MSSRAYEAVGLGLVATLVISQLPCSDLRVAILGGILLAAIFLIKMDPPRIVSLKVAYHGFSTEVQFNQLEASKP